MDYESLYRELVYSISHDITQPLRNVKALLGELNLDSDDNIEISAHMKSQIQKALFRVEGLLKISRLENLKLHREHFCPQATLEKIVENEELSLKGLPSPFKIYFDKEILETIFRELASNSKSNNATKILFSLHDDGINWVIQIQDDGDGIEEELLVESTKLFRQIRKTADESRQGFGLYYLSRLCERAGINFSLSTSREGLITELSIPKEVYVSN